LTKNGTFEDKLKLARQLGADRVYTAAEFEGAAPEAQFEVVIDCTGVPRVIENSIRSPPPPGGFPASPDGSSRVFSRTPQGKPGKKGGFLPQRFGGIGKPFKKQAVIPANANTLPASSFFKG
jgi:hypothetical protein